jgi:hypothetical protein
MSQAEAGPRASPMRHRSRPSSPATPLVGGSVSLIWPSLRPHCAGPPRLQSASRRPRQTPRAQLVAPPTRTARLRSRPPATKGPPPVEPWKTLRTQLAGVVKLIWANPAGATFFLVAVGALGFGWAWSLDAFFYAEVGVSPQVVGASYPNVLASAFLGYLMLVLLVFSVFLVILALLWLLSRLSSRFEDVGRW